MNTKPIMGSGYSPETMLLAFRAVSDAALHAAAMLERALSDMSAGVQPPADTGALQGFYAKQR